MNTYIFKTTTTMKDYNNAKYWIDSGIIRDITVQAEKLEAALAMYQETVTDNFYISVSNNAIKNKQPMYIDDENGETKQVGFVITASTTFEDRDNYKTTKQFVDLWVTVLTVVETDF